MRTALSEVENLIIIVIAKNYKLLVCNPKLLISKNLEHCKSSKFNKTANGKLSKLNGGHKQAVKRCTLGKDPCTSKAKSAIARIANIEKLVSVIKNQRVTKITHVRNKELIVNLQ